jgi:hypothetical protein
MSLLVRQPSPSQGFVLGPSLSHFVGEGKKGNCLLLLARRQAGEEGGRCDRNGKVRVVIRD